MPESRFLKIVIICLLLLNAGTLGFLFLNDPQHRPGPRRGGPGRAGPDRGGAFHFLNENLGLTAAQEAQYRNMRDEHHAAAEALHAEMDGRRRDLYRMMSSGKDSMQAAAVLDSMCSDYRKIEWLTWTHFRELRSICTPGQQKKFDVVIGEALERMR